MRERGHGGDRGEIALAKRKTLTKARRRRTEMRVSTKMTAMQVRSTRSKMKLDSIATTTATTEGGGKERTRGGVFGGVWADLR